MNQDELLAGPWKDLFARYLINYYGVVKRKSDNHILCPCKGETKRRQTATIQYHYTMYDAKNKLIGRSIAVLVQEKFGTREHLTDELFMQIRELVGYNKQSNGKKDHRNETGTRKCATCGCPTNNYRCHKCWEEIRGFGLSGDNYNSHTSGINDDMI